MFPWSTPWWNFEDVFWHKFFIFSSTLSMTLPFHSMSSDLSMPCLLHYVSIQSLNPSITVDLTFFSETLLVSPYLVSLVNSFLNLLFPTIRKSPVTICQWSLPVIPELAQLHGKKVWSWTKILTSRLETNSLKLNILDLIGIVSKYATVGSSNLKSVGKHTDGWWMMKRMGYISKFHTFIQKGNFTNISGCFFFVFRYCWFEYRRFSNTQSERIPMKVYIVSTII